jgi:hypothetical protein
MGSCLGTLMGQGRPELVHYWLVMLNNFVYQLWMTAWNHLRRKYLHQRKWKTYKFVHISIVFYRDSLLAHTECEHSACCWLFP